MNRNSSGRRYDREFKNNAVALVRGGRTITEVARDLGVSKWSLGHWVRQAEEGQLLSEPKTLALETPEQRELRRLRQELEDGSRQRDILKKALGILSAEMPPPASRVDSAVSPCFKGRAKYDKEIACSLRNRWVMCLKLHCTSSCSPSRKKYWARLLWDSTYW
jgi:transposase